MAVATMLALAVTMAMSMTMTMMMAVAVTMSLVALLLAVDAIFLHTNDQLVAQLFKLRTLFLGQRFQDLFRSLVLGGVMLLGDLLALFGQLNGVGFLLVALLDDDITVALSLAHDVFQSAAINAKHGNELALRGAIVFEQRAQQRTLAALVALRAVLALSQASKLACLLHLHKGFSGIVHAVSPSNLPTSFERFGCALLMREDTIALSKHTYNVIHD